MSEWISVDTGLPPLDVPVWLVTNNGGIFIGCRSDDAGGWLWGNCYGDFWLDSNNKWRTDTCETDDYNVTHWMPLPAPPVSP